MCVQKGETYSASSKQNFLFCKYKDAKQNIFFDFSIVINVQERETVK